MTHRIVTEKIESHILPEVTVLIDREEVYLFAETGRASDYLRSFAGSMNLPYYVGHGSKELGTYKDYTLLIIKSSVT